MRDCKSSVSIVLYAETARAILSSYNRNSLSTSIQSIVLWNAATFSYSQKFL